jgi:hypothetical protein
MHYEEFFAILRRQRYDRTIIVELRPTGNWDAFESSAEFLQEYRFPRDK